MCSRQLFPPCTGLSCLDVSKHGTKKCLLVNAQVSTARLDTSQVLTPAYVPGTAEALAWATALLGCSAAELAAREEWDLSEKNLSADEHVQKLALLVGRASAVAMPALRAVKLQNCQLTLSGAALLADGVAHSQITSLKCAPCPLSNQHA